jgi:hypothetical protein
MEIQSKEKELIISFKSSKVYVQKDDEGYMQVRITAGEDKNFEFSKPGEYGYGNLNFIALENNAESYTSKLNLLLISTNSNVNILVKYNDLDIDKSSMGRISGANVIISDLRNSKNITGFVKKFEPERLVFTKVKASENDRDLKSLQEIGSVEETDKLKLEDSIFNHAEEVATKIFVLTTK